MIAAGLLIVILGCGLLASSAETSFTLAMPVSLVLIGAGTAMAVPAVANAALADVPPQAAGTASGILNAVRQVGGAMGVALFGSFVAGAPTPDGGMASIAAIAAAAAAGGAMLLLARQSQRWRARKAAGTRMQSRAARSSEGDE